MTDVYPPVVNVTPPPQDPKATKRVFEELEKRKEWDLGGLPTAKNWGGGGAPPLRPTGDDKGEPREPNPEPLPVPEINMSEMQEYAVKEDLTCWNCNKAQGRKIPQNGCVLCPACESTMKP